MADIERDIEESEEQLDTDQADQADIVRWEGRQREIVTSVVDYNLGTLSNLVKEGDINLSPAYQRRFRWDKKRQSQLIESFLMNVPVPPVFLNEDGYGEYSVIDGKQRLAAISTYFEGKFALEGLEEFKDLNGKCFQELTPQLQRVLRTRPILRAVFILKQSDPNVKFDVFHRLNTGGVKLNPQEVRNNVFPGPLNDLIHKLSTLPDFHQILGIEDKQKSAIYREMRDAEFVLRFFALKDSWETAMGQLRSIMDNFMDDNQKPAKGDQNQKAYSRFLADLERDFLRTISEVKAAFGNKAFRRWQTDKEVWRKQMLAALYDAEIIACYQFSKNHEDAKQKLAPKSAEIIARLQQSFHNDAFRDSILAATNTPKNFRYRIQTVLNILNEVTAR